MKKIYTYNFKMLKPAVVPTQNVPLKWGVSCSKLGEEITKKVLPGKAHI